MSYSKLNSRSIRLFVATKDELARNPKKPHLNAPYFRVNREDVVRLLELAGDGDPILSVAVWRRKGQDGKPDYFTAELTYPGDADTMHGLRTKDDEWLSNHPRTAEDNRRRQQYAMEQKAADKMGLTEANDDLPF